MDSYTSRHLDLKTKGESQDSPVHQSNSRIGFFWCVESTFQFKPEGDQMAVTNPEQEQLARDNVSNGGRFVCLARTQGKEEWNFALATDAFTEAENWWNAQCRPARVFEVRRADVLIRFAK